MIHGIDVSNNNGTIRWHEVPFQEEFAVIKASEGTGFIDGFFGKNWNDCERVRGAYHFAQPDYSQPEDEADLFLNIVESSLEKGDFVALDLEVGHGSLFHWARTWLYYVSDRLGWAPFLYSYPNFMELHNLLNQPDLQAFPLWYANYRPDMPPPPAVWPAITIWQHDVSVAGYVPGIDTRCDLNWFNGRSIEDLIRLGKGGNVVEHNPWWDQVGPGIQSAMHSETDEPTGPEEYIKSDEGTNILSRAPGQKGLYIACPLPDGRWNVTFTPWK